MAKEKVSFREFLSVVATKHQAFVEKLNNKLIEQGCELVIKEAKSGYAASYQLEKKTVMNWVFRKAGVLARIYGDNSSKYEGVIASLPADMQRKMITSRDCKRLIDPNACSDTCVKGFVYSLNNDVYKKCRNDGMLFLLTNETEEHIADFICLIGMPVMKLFDVISQMIEYRFYAAITPTMIDYIKKEYDSASADDKENILGKWREALCKLDGIKDENYRCKFKAVYFEIIELLKVNGSIEEHPIMTAFIFGAFYYNDYRFEYHTDEEGLGFRLVQ